jgi:hypothetical protein
VKIFGDNAGVPSRHRPAGRDRLYQRAIRSKEIIPVVAVGVVEQFAQRLCRKGLHFHARNVLLPRLTASGQSASFWATATCHGAVKRRLTAQPPGLRLAAVKTGCAMRGEKIADVVRTLIEREFPPQS